jgi:acetyltransferase-like isoleucine patch superfamily enzyme
MLSLKRYFVNAFVSLMPPTRAFGLKRFLWRLNGDQVGTNSSINSGAKVWGIGRVSIGADTWLGMNLVMIVPKGAEVIIGANVDIGPDVLLECGWHDIGGPERRAGVERATSIKIGAGTWVGCRATLLGGASVGVGSVIAAGAMVLPGNYPDNVLLAGVPARVVRQFNEAREEAE